jgi:Uma2 family endonuclease
MELPQESGIEPDYCFYIENWEAIAGKDRINWGVDPSPDLVMEIDITSYTDVDHREFSSTAATWYNKVQSVTTYFQINRKGMRTWEKED